MSYVRPDPMLSLKPYIAHYRSESCGCADSAQPTPPLTAHLLERFGNQERQFKRLIGVRPGVAVGVVAVGQAGFADRSGAADAFGNVLPGHLNMNPAGLAALGLMHGEELLNLGEDLRKVACLVTA
jgi:hypothetical protein